MIRHLTLALALTAVLAPAPALGGGAESPARAGSAADSAATHAPITPVAGDTGAPAAVPPRVRPRSMTPT